MNASSLSVMAFIAVIAGGEVGIAYVQGKGEDEMR
jgi:hypothetical protein